MTFVWIAGIAVGCFIVAGILSMILRAMGADPADHQAITELEDLGRGHHLGAGPVRVQLIRQSGNLYRDLGAFETADEGLRAVKASFRRAGIDRIRVTSNRPGRYEVGRRWWSGRGSSEGKKMGRAVITTL